MTNKPSVFASVLRRLLDESGVFTRSQWAEFLRVSEPAISQWLNDHTLPKAEYLKKIIWVLRNSDDVPQHLINEYEELLEKPAVSVSPHHKRVGRTFGGYVIKSLVDSFLNDLQKLKPTEQEKILLSASMQCKVETHPSDLTV